VIVLEQGRLAFDGGVDEGIKFVKYDEPEKADGDELGTEDTDEELGSDF